MARERWKISSAQRIATGTLGNTLDVIAIQHFFLGQTTGIGNVGKYQFTPANRTCSGVVSNQIGQNYDALVFGDVASHFVERTKAPVSSAAVPLR